MYDFIILGAGPAGCFSATELARKGKKVCVLEKERRAHRKVCGDGISAVCVEVLRLMDFPVEWFLSAGALPIDTYCRYEADGSFSVRNVAAEGRIAYGFPRDRTDELFQRYARECFHVPIFYETPVWNIEETETGYRCGSRTAHNIIVAAGANARISLSGEPLNVYETPRPVGVSMTVRAPRSKRDRFFLFDYQEKYGGAYAWIFAIGSGLYNVGLWLREGPERLRLWLMEFYENRGREWLGEETEIVEKPRGAYMGIGKKVRSPARRGIYLVGDADGSANPEDGEGISRAIISAKNLVLGMADINR